MIRTTSTRFAMTCIAIVQFGCGDIQDPFEDTEESNSTPLSKFETVHSRKDATALLTTVTQNAENSEAFGAYLTESESGESHLQIIDVSRPESPLSIGKPFEGNIRKALLSQNYLLTLRGAQELSVFSLVDRSNPKLIGKIPVGDDLIHDFAFDAEKNNLIVSTEMDGLLSYSISENSAKWQSSKIAVPNKLKKPFARILMKEDSVFLTNAELTQVHILRFGKRNEITLDSTIVTGGKISKLRSAENSVFICDFQTGLHVMKLKKKKWEKSLHLNVNGVLRDATLHDGNLLLANDSEGRDLGLDLYSWGKGKPPVFLDRHISKGVNLSVSSILGLIYTVEEFKGEKSLQIMRVNL